MRGILKGKGAFELTHPHTELLVLYPLGIEVNELHSRLTRTFRIRALDLSTPVEFAYLSIKDETGQTQVELVVLATFFILCLILQHAVAAKLKVIVPLGGFFLSAGSQCEGGQGHS